MAAGKLKCETAITRLWKRAKEVGIDEAQWSAAYAGAREAATAIDGGVEAANALASLVTAFRQYEAEIRNEVARLKSEEDDKTSYQMRLMDKVGEREGTTKGLGKGKAAK